MIGTDRIFFNDLIRKAYESPTNSKLNYLSKVDLALKKHDKDDQHSRFVDSSNESIQPNRQKP